MNLLPKGLGPVQWTEPKGSPSADANIRKDFSLIFTQGKIAEQWHQTLTNWSAYMGQFGGGNLIWIHPKTAAEQGVANGEWIYIETEVGKNQSEGALDGRNPSRGGMDALIAQLAESFHWKPRDEHKRHHS